MLLAVLLLTKFLATSAINLHCEFLYERWIVIDYSYSCEAEARAISTSRTVASVAGSHLLHSDTKLRLRNADVRALMVRDQPNLTYFPAGIHKHLPALRAIDLEGCALRKIAAGDLAPFPELLELSLAGNRLTELPHDLFAHTPAIRKVDFEDNWLMHVGREIFDRSAGLNMVNLVDNVCVSERARTRDELRLLAFDMAVECPPTLGSFEREVLASEALQAEVRRVVEETLRAREIVRELRAKVEAIERKIDAK